MDTARQSRQSRNRVLLVLVLDSSVFDYEDQDDEEEETNELSWPCLGGFFGFGFLVGALPHCALCVKTVGGSYGDEHPGGLRATGGAKHPAA